MGRKAARYDYSLIQVAFSSVYFSSACSDLSRPLPDCLKPPNGAVMSPPSYWLTQTQGVCGMCETRVLDGVPDHRDMLLSESERASGDVMMLCVSRAHTQTLTLDL